MMIRRLGFAGNLEDLPQLADAFQAAGLCPREAQRKAVLAVDCVGSLPRRPIQQLFYVPGRIEVLGKHTDYAGGDSLVFAVEQGFCIAVAPRSDRHVRLCAASTGETIGCDLDADFVPTQGHWANYPMTVARRVARNFPDATRGAEVAFASDLPPAAGMSSSSALVIGVFLAIAEVNRLWESSAWKDNLQNVLDLASYLATVENGQSFRALKGDRGVGTFGGSEDHTAILTSQPGHILWYAYQPVRFRRAIPIPDGLIFCVAASGVSAEKTGKALEKYNAASRLASQLTQLWQQAIGKAEGSLAEILASDPDAKIRLARIVAELHFSPQEQESLRRRLEHFAKENCEILPQAVDALEKGDLSEFGRWVDLSQQAAEELLGNQIPETSFLAKSARECGAIAASAFGAGFGGAVWALVPGERAGEFLARWAERYRAAFPHSSEAARFFSTHAGPATFGLL